MVMQNKKKARKLNRFGILEKPLLILETDVRTVVQ